MAWNMQQATDQMYLLVGAPTGWLFHKTLLTFQNFWQIIFDLSRDLLDE